MSHYKSNVRDQVFNLFEVLGVDKALGEGEYADPETQLHRHVLYHVQEGDVVVVDARGDMRSGIFGDMMST